MIDEKERLILQLARDLEYWAQFISNSDAFNSDEVREDLEASKWLVQDALRVLGVGA